jgi:hypothetical protein
MPITPVNTPSGQVIRVNHPEGATEDQIIAFAARNFETSTDDDGLLMDVGKGLLTGGLQAAINAGAGFEQVRGMLMPEDEDTSDEAIDAYVSQQPLELGLTRGEVRQHRIKKNQAKDKALDNAVRLRGLANSIGERIGLDQDFAQSLPGQIVQGFGQVPVSLAAGVVGGAVAGAPGAVGGVVASAFPQMLSEAVNDAEGTLGKSYSEMNSDERDQVALSSMGYATLGTALESVGFLKTVPGLKNFLRGGGKLTSGQLKSLKREVAEGFASEGFTESTQGQLLDSFAKATYDDDRELMSMEVLGQRFNEFLIGGVVGGGTAGGFGAFERASRGTLFQPRETKAVSTGGEKIFEVTYTDNAGNQRTRPVQASTEQEAEGIALETITDANLDEQFIISEPGIEVTETPEVPREEVAVTGETIEFDLTPEEIDTINQELANETDPIGQAGDRIPNILDEDDVTAKAFTPYKEEMMPRPEVVEAALPIFRKLKAGERITLEESRNLASVVDRVNPVRPYKEVPPPASEADMRRALNEGQLPKINKARDVETGTFVKLRLDIPAYREKGVWVPTIHGSTEKTRGFRGGATISHQSTSVVTNARFGVIGYDNPTGQALAAGIAAKEESKIPVATILGEYVNLSEDQAVARAEAVINDPSFIQVGMDPKRRGYFYNRETMQEVLSADEVIQVGPLVLAKNPVYGKTPSNEFLSREVEGAVDQDVVAEAAPSVSQVSSQNDASRVGTAKLPTGTTSESNIDTSIVPDDVLASQMASINYKHLPDDIRNEKDPKTKYEKFVEFIKSNLLYLHDQFPEDLRARATLWYDGANKIANDLASRYNLSVEQVSAVIANLSPQKDWFMNIAQAEQVLHVYENYQDFKIEGSEVDRNIENIIDAAEAPKSQKKKKQPGETKLQETRRRNFNKKLDQEAKDKRAVILNAIRGKTIRELNKDKSEGGKVLTGWAIRVIAQAEFGRYYQILSPEGDPVGIQVKNDGDPSMNTWGSISEITKAVSVIENGSAENISNSLGDQHKVRNFYNNIVAPNSPSGDATIDTHAVAAGLIMPLGASATQVNHNFGGDKIKNAPSLGISGTYHIYLEAYRRAAKERNLQPRQMQSITWEAVRKLFLPTERDPADIDRVTQIWNNAENENTARDTITGQRVLRPDWARPAGSTGPEVVTTGLLGQGREDVLGGDLQFRGRKSGPIPADQSRERAIERLRIYSGTVSYRTGNGKSPGRRIKTAKGKPTKLSSAVFSKTARENKKAHKFGASVDVLSPRKYNGYDLIRIKNDAGGTVTLSISPDGEVGSVTKSSKATEADVDAVFDAAIATGRVKFLNGFETVLPDIYANYGFKPVARLKFDPQFQPPGWSYATYKKYNDGQPDVIFMRFTGELGSTYNPEGFSEVQTYEAGIEAAQVEPVVTAEAITAQRPSAPEGGFASVRQLEEFIRDNFKTVASKVGVDIVPNYTISADAQYNVTKGYIEYNPRSMFTNRTQDGTSAAMREEIIHAAMHKVLIQRSPSKSRNNAWLDFMGKLGKDLTQEQRDAIAGVYTNLQEDHQFGAEYSRAAIQYLLYGNVTEQYVVGGKSWETIKSLFKSVQRFLARTLGKDIETNPEAAAVIRDSVDLVLRSDPEARITNQKISSEARRIADRAEGKGAVDTDIIVNAANPPSKKKKIGFFDKYINTASSVLNSISPRLNQLFQRYFQKIEETTKDRLRAVSPFIKKFNGIRDEKDKKRLKQLLYYSPSVKGSEDAVALTRERDLLLQKYGMFNEYNLVVRPIFDDIRMQANEQGMDVDYLEDYFPRRIIDLPSVERILGKTVAVDFRSHIDRINEDRAKETDASKRKPLIEQGSVEEALEFDKYIRSGLYSKRGIITKHTKKRTYELIDLEIIDAYADPGQAIEAYIQNMTTATETMRLLGRRFETDDAQLITPNQERPGELGLLIQELLANGQIDSEQAYGTLPDLAKVILNPAMKEIPALGAMRTFSYFTLLVEPTTTISNLFDLPFQMFENGFFRTLGAMVGGKTFRLEDVGISKDDIGAEFRNERKLMADALRIGLRATGFSRIDQLMKETALNANYKRIRSLANGYLKNRDSAKSKKLKTELDFILGDDADAAIAAFAKGDRNNPLVREVLLRKLLETQPINRLEMPLSVSANPNLRMLYTMKSFMIKQLDFVRTRMLNEMFGRDKTSAQRLRGATDLAKLMFFMLMIGLPVDALKDFLAGRSGYFSDYMFNGVARLFGISRYQAYVARKEGIGQAAFDFVTPVGIQQFVDTTAAAQRVLSGQRAITDSKLVTLAPMSDVLNRLFGFSREREMREFKRRLGEGELPTFIPPGAL